MTIFGALILILILMLIFGGLPVSDANRNPVTMILMVILVLWIVLALFGPLSYSSRGWVIW